MPRFTPLVAIAGLLCCAAPSLAATPPVAKTSTPIMTGATSAKSTAPVVARTPGVDLLDQVNEHYRGLTSYDVQGTSHMNMDIAGQMQTIDVPFRLAGAKPARLRTEIMSPVMPFANYSDGSKTWVFLPRERQYTVKDATPSASGDEGSRLTMGTPLQRYFTLREGLVSARIVGKGSAMLGKETVPCTLIEAQYASPDTTRFKLSPNLYWVDAKRKIVLRDSLQVRMTGNDGRPVSMTTIVTFDRIDLNPTLADTTFAFQPPSDAKLVTSFDMPGMGKEPVSPFVGKPAQEIALSDLAGKKQKLSSLKGKVVLLDFWATWCGPCRRELPVIAKLHQELSAKGLAVVAVNVGEQRATVEAFLKKNAFDLPVWLDTESEVSAAYEARSIPTLVVIDRDGKVSAYKVGARQEEDLRALLTEAGLD